MRQPTLFAMYRHRVVAEIADRIGLVVADIEIALMPMQVEHDIREPRIAIVENADVDLARDAFEYRREAVHRDQQRAPAARAPRFEQLHSQQSRCAAPVYHARPAAA